MTPPTIVERRSVNNDNASKNNNNNFLVDSDDDFRPFAVVDTSGDDVDTSDHYDNNGTCDGLFRTSSTSAAAPPERSEVTDDGFNWGYSYSVMNTLYRTLNDRLFTYPRRLLRRSRRGESLLNEQHIEISNDDNREEQQRQHERTAKRRSAMIAACFLKDYEEGRSPTFRYCYCRSASQSTAAATAETAKSDRKKITDRQLQIYWFKYSKLWQILGLGIATLCLFLGHLPSHPVLTLALHLYAWAIFCLDWFMATNLRSSENENSTKDENIEDTTGLTPPRAPSQGHHNHKQQGIIHEGEINFHLDTSISVSESSSSSSFQNRRYLRRPKTSRQMEHLIQSRLIPLLLVMFFIETWTVFVFSSCTRSSTCDQGNNENNSDPSVSPPPFIFQIIVTLTGLLKPIVLFYMSRKARDALQALVRVVQKLASVILVEMFLILVFAAVACRLFSSSSLSQQRNNANDDGGRQLQEEEQQYNDYIIGQQEDQDDDHLQFENLVQSWLSLFALSTTVVNPGLWLPAYDESRWNAVFFALFIVVAIFYLHSLVLSVIFQVFVQSAQQVHKQSTSDREKSIRMAFLALLDEGLFQDPSKSTATLPNQRLLRVDPELIYEMFSLLRPHYSKLKLKVLMDMIILDHEHHTSEPSWHGRLGTQEERDESRNAEVYHFLDYSEFRMRVTEGLNSSIRISRAHSHIGLAIEVLSAGVAIANFVYVVLLTSQFNGKWFIKSEFVVGSVLTLLSLFEVLMRYNPLKIRHYPFTRLNAVLDGCALLGALISLCGIGVYLTDNTMGLEILFTGRAMSMIQCMRFSVWGREVLQRSISVLPAMTGPILLVLTTMHIFVCIGMILWQGTVDPIEMAQNENVEYLFWNNNFNSYTEGLVTILNVMVINDWHQIANVFLYASRFSSPVIVYVYFVSVVIVAVSVMLNLIVVFFCETFVSQLNLVDAGDEGSSVLKACTSGPDAGLSIKIKEEDFVMKSLTPIATSLTSSLHFDSNDLKRRGIKTKICEKTNQDIQFDIIQKEGYDELMKAIANTSDRQNEELAINLRNTLELLSPAGGDTGYMVCVSRSQAQFPTQSFKRLVKDYVSEEEMSSLMSETTDSLGLDEASVPSTPLTMTPHHRHSGRGIGSQQAASFRRVIPKKHVPSSDAMASSLEVSAFLVPDNRNLILVTAKKILVDKFGP